VSPPHRETPESQAAGLMTVEMISGLLASTDPRELGEKLTEQLRELTGARTVLLIAHRAGNAAAELLHACPARRATLFPAEELALFCPEQTPEPLPRRSEELPPDHPLRAALARAGVQSLLRFPLRAGGEPLGTLLLLDLPVLDRMDDAVKAVTLLSPPMALALRNALARQQIEKQAREIQRYAAELEQLVRGRTAELARSNAELEQFAYVASHDLQEPLRMVSSYVQLLAHRYQDKLDSDANEFIAFAVDGAKRMQALINDLLSFSRVGTRGKPFEPTDCGLALDCALDNLRVAIEESGATVIRAPLPTVAGDATQLTELFQNLIGNAVKFRRPQEPPRVEVAAERRAGEWLFSVRDNGIGLDMRFAERIFMIFQRLHTRREYPGTGIGLAMCKKIVERHGGRIWVESAPGKGATFYFTIPASA